MSDSPKNMPLRVGFIGGGIDSAIGQAHFAALHIDRNFSLESGIFSIDSTANKESGVRYRVCEDRVYDKLDEFLGAEAQRLDAVIVLTPTPLHFEHINKVFDKNLAVISEKALCTNSKDAQELSERVTTEKQFLSVTFTYTGYPMVRQIKEAILAGEYGRILSIDIEMPQESFIKLGPTGEVATAQEWRKRDYELPSVTLDVGSHVINLLEFITPAKLVEISAVANHSGDISHLIDNVLSIGSMSDGALLSLRWNKISLGKRNGLALRIFGERASISWEQENPEYLSYTSKSGIRQILDRSNFMLKVATEVRYQRFKPGHPAGYIEAFANLYSDIADDLIAYKNSDSSIVSSESSNPYTHDVKNSLEGLKILETIHQSAQSRQLLSIKR